MKLAGYSFKELAAQTRCECEHAAFAQALCSSAPRQRLQSIYEDFKEP